ncbi:hypothetical protein XENOCAPTIV_029812 [Xenoophorus captivus]|uniref:Uncharacterized protein n=1 Tax=Xenoophorus captivus TaxID=1517983 RepID=A0ABV0QPP1_9TELE
MLPVSRALLDRDRELDTMAGVHANPAGAPGAVRGMKRGDPEPDGQTAATLVDSTGAECKRPRIDGSGGIGEVGQCGKQSGKGTLSPSHPPQWQPLLVLQEQIFTINGSKEALSPAYGITSHTAGI